MHASSPVPSQSRFHCVTADRGGKRSGAFLDRMDTLVAWEEIAEELTPEQYTATTGRPGFPVTILLKCLFLARWYGLSDPELEDQLRDRLSFQRFVGIVSVKEIPDETTIGRFRNKLIPLGGANTLFATVQRLIDDHGVRVKRGRIVDATIIDAPKGAKRSDGASTRDPEAAGLRRNTENPTTDTSIMRRQTQKDGSLNR